MLESLVVEKLEKRGPGGGEGVEIVRLCDEAQ